MVYVELGGVFGRHGPARAPFGTLPSPKNDTARGGVRIVVVAERRPFFHRLRVTDFSPPSIAIITSGYTRLSCSIR
jgi:hypothetical protein